MARIKFSWKAAGITALVVLGFATRFLWIQNPSQVVFDEVHFGKFASAYFDGHYYFDIHPPLGKLLIAAGAALSGYGAYVREHGVFDFATIGEQYAAMPYVGFRLFPAIAGALLPLAVYFFVRSLNGSDLAALGTGFLALFDNALLTQSRLALMDSFLLLFGFLGLATFFVARNKGYDWKRLALSGFLFGLSISVKWTGLSFLGLAGLVYLYDAFRSVLANRSQAFSVIAPRFFIALACFIIVPLLVYYAVFAVHFHLLVHPGSGDAYMDQNFWRLPTLGRFIELNDKMYFYNTTLKATHPYGSPAWTWPFMVRPIYYWIGDVVPGAAARIYLIGNPVAWMLGVVGLICGLFIDKLGEKQKFVYAVLFIGYLANFIPFFDITRVLFLYHYFAALIFSFALVSVWLAEATEHLGRRTRMALYVGLGAAVFAGFVFFAPLAYGSLLTDHAYHLRTWMQSWI